MSKKPNWFVFCVAGCLVLAGCGGGDTGTGPAGSMDLNLQLAGDVDLDAIDYEISGNGIDPILGTVDVAGQSSVSFEIHRIPVGLGFLLALTGADGTTSCEAQASFDIGFGQTTPVNVVFKCDRSSATGTVEITSNSSNFCPQLTDMVASAQLDGAAFAVSATATDEEGDLITFTWSSTSGSFDAPSTTDPSSVATTFNCAQAGDTDLTVDVDDGGSCIESQTLTVGCVVAAVVQNPPVIAYRANQDSAANMELYTSGWDGSGNQKLSGTLQPGGLIYFFKWSPDGTKMAFTADAETDNVPELYVVDADGTNLVKINPTLVPGGLVSTNDWAWSPDGSRIAYLARQDADDTLELYTSFADGTGNQKINAPLVALGQVDAFAWAPNGSRIAYIASQYAYAQDELFTALPDGGDKQRVNPPYSFPQTVGSTGTFRFAWSPNSAWIAYVAEQDTDNKRELYVGNPSGTINNKVSGTMQSNGDVTAPGGLPPVEWSPNSSRIAYRADASIDNRFELFTNTPTGTNNVKVSGTMVASPAVGYFTWHPSGSQLAYVATQGVPGRNELYVTSQSAPSWQKWSAPTVTGVESVAALEPPFRWAASGSRIVYRGDSSASPGQMELFSSIGNPGSVQKLNGALPPGANVGSFTMSPSSTRVAYLADQDVVGELSLYTVSPFGGGDFKISGASLSGAGVTSPFGSHPSVVWSADGSRLAYLNDEDTAGRSELYTSTDAGLNKAKASGTIGPPTGDVQAYNIEWRP